MDSATRTFVDQWWANVFDVDSTALWQGSSVRRHTVLGDYPGWYVGWHGAGAHVSAPTYADQKTLTDLGWAGPEELSTVGFWRSFADHRGLSLIGPALHTYLDEDPGDDGSAPRIDPGLVRPLKAAVTEAEWAESGFAGEPEVVFGCFASGELVAAANLTDFAGNPADVSLLVRPDFRGRGLGHRVAGAAASYAVRRHGVARWRCRSGHEASLAIAKELGFEEYVRQLAVRRGRTG